MEKSVMDIGEDDVIGCASNRTIESAILILGSNNFRRLPITKLGKIEGILTITDILSVIAKVGIQNSFKEKVSDWMTVKPKKVHLKTDILESIKLMNSKKIGSLLLVDDNPEMCRGIITERDILYHYDNQKWNNTKLKNIDPKFLKIGFEFISYHASLEEAIKKMSENNTHRLIVRSKEGEGIFGLISANDITHLITKEREEISNNSNFLNSITAGFVSSGKLTTINHESTVMNAVTIMREQRFGAIPVMGSNGNIIGIFSERSLLYYIAENE